MNKVTGFVGLLGSLGLASACAQAQVNQVGIDNLVVIGDRVGHGAVEAQVLDVGQLSPGSRADAAELLQGIPGVQADSRSNYAQDTRITLRGFGARSAFGVRGLDLQIDGIPLTMPDGQGQFSGAVLDGVTQISVLTGPVSALYGNGAGGVINLKTSTPQRDRIAVDTTSGEDGLNRHHLVTELRAGSLGVRVQASHMDAEGNRPHAEAEREQFGAQVYYTLDNGVKAQWRFDKENAPLLQDPLGLTQEQWLADPYQLNGSAEFFDTRKSISHLQNAFSLRQEHGDQRWQFVVWQGQREIQQYLAQRGDALSNSGGVVDLDRKFNGGSGNYTWDFSLLNQPSSFTLGGEWSSMDDRRKGYVNNAGVAGELRRDELGQADNRDAYALLQWQASDDWQFLVGARRSHLELSVDDYFIIPTKNADDSGEKIFNRNSASISTRYKFDENIWLHVAVGKGFETPTLTEMAYTNGDKGFNNTLDAASNRQQEMGVTYDQKAIKISLTAFAIQTQRELVVDQSINGRTTYINAAETERKGVEFNGNFQLSERLGARIALNSLRATYTEGAFESMQLPGVAKINHYVQVNWSLLPNELLKIGLNLNHRDQVATSDNNQIKAPAYTSADVNLSGKFNLIGNLQSDWWLKVANITDKNYVGSVIVNQSNGRAFEPASERNFAAGVELNYLF